MKDQEVADFTENVGMHEEENGYVCEICIKMYREDEAKEQGMSCCGRALKELTQEETS